MVLRPGSSRREVIAAYQSVRKMTEDLCAPLQTEDYVVQSMEDVSPPKWHLGHTTWFFETFLLASYTREYRPHHADYAFLFNSYYETMGDRWIRAKRGLLSRPTVKEVYAFRAAIDGRMLELIQSVPDQAWEYFRFLVDLGLNHEQQHQELLVYDFKHILATNPIHPVYLARNDYHQATAVAAKFHEFEGGIVEIGHRGPEFSFDNERPRHRVLLENYKLMNRSVTNGEYLDFMNSGGYADFRHWLSEGWTQINTLGWNSPLYWEQKDGEWHVMTLSGFQKLRLDEPVCHVSYFEADAFARWAGKRLPTEAEWEHAAESAVKDVAQGNFLDSRRFHPAPAAGQESMLQMFGDVWEWTSSAYLAYPGFKPEAGAVSEYNGKFMSNQMVLKGGSCATPSNHIRAAYRNFFQCDKRWVFSGIRLAEN